MFRLIENQTIVPNIYLMTVEAPEVARAVQPGQFVIVRPEEDGERIPLSVADWDAEKGTITILYMVVGRTTQKLSRLRRDQALPTVVGPLGTPLEIDYYGTVMCLGGCYGIGSIYPVARALKEKGNKVIIGIEAKGSFLFYWEEKLKQVTDQIIYITRDGSKGYRGHVSQLTGLLESMAEPVDRIIINGCNLLLQSGSDASRPLGIKTLVCLNTIMIDGTGMCGVCRVSVGGETKFACVDGPYFDGHLVNWTELAQRRQSYLSEEVLTLRSSASEKMASELFDFSC